jgi:elongation factor G
MTKLMNGVRFDTVDIPDDYADQAAEYRESLIEALSDFDDELATKYLEGEEITEDELRWIRKATYQSSL